MSSASLGSTDDPFALRITRWYQNEPLRALRIFLEGLAVGLLLVLLCLLISTNN